LQPIAIPSPSFLPNRLLGESFALRLLCKWSKLYYLYVMITSQVKIDFTILSRALKEYVRQKALQSNSTILYKKGNQLIEENPKTSQTKILKEYIHS
jgi:hypothetical protein